MGHLLEDSFKQRILRISVLILVLIICAFFSFLVGASLGWVRICTEYDHAAYFGIQWKWIGEDPSGVFGVEIAPRINVLKMARDKSLATKWSLFVQSYDRIQRLPINDTNSFYEIASIHGYPKGLGFRGVSRSNETEEGFCPHGINIFTMWHRAYLLVIERALKKAAYTIVSEHPKNQNLSKAAKDLRFPFWDAMDPEVPELPEELTAETLVIQSLNDSSKNISVRNPLRSYQVQTTINEVYNRSNQHHPEHRPYSAPVNKTDYPMLMKGLTTVRHVDHNHETNLTALRQRYREQKKTVASQTRLTFAKANNWTTFSTKNESVYSVEKAHDTVHDIIGGDGGSMAYIPVAAYDPIFFLHHCNIDRLFALWQQIHPDQYTDLQEDLVPFWKSKNDKTKKFNFYKTSDVRDFRKFGYTYEEIEENKDLTSEEWRHYLVHKYSFPMTVRCLTCSNEISYITGKSFLLETMIERKFLGKPFFVAMFVKTKGGEQECEGRQHVSLAMWAGRSEMFNSVRPVNDCLRKFDVHPKTRQELVDSIQLKAVVDEDGGGEMVRIPSSKWRLLQEDQ